MKQVTDTVYMFESTKSSRAFLVKLKNRMIIIDTSTPGKGTQMLAELTAGGMQASSITDILLTHHDADHIGSAAYLQAATGAKLWMHKKDIANTMGRKKRPLFKSFIGTFMKPELPEITGIIAANGEIVPGILAIQAPGHTPGHTVYLNDGVLFSGDAVKVKKDGTLRLLPGFLTADKKTALESMQAISQLNYTLICPAHQEPKHFTAL
ncbi:unnamed protein product [Sphagnum jensenii]|uniref:Metallo-beta-lactamase domain-containing protein n=1 Tax=Sphagnum jensenii TaxID=128206 RepID=A0ABP0VCE7_9BRYO